MTNSWAMLFDYHYGSDEVLSSTQYTDDTAELILNDIGDDVVFAAGIAPIPGAEGEDVITFEGPDWMGADARAVLDSVVITDDTTPSPVKDTTFWKYSEGKILREVEQYLSSTYKGHYVGEESKVQTLDLIDSIGDAEAFCRSNAIKYLSRFGKKDGKNAKDLLKVIHYAMLLYHFSELPFSEDAKETFSPMGR